MIPHALATHMSSLCRLVAMFLALFWNTFCGFDTIVIAVFGVVFPFKYRSVSTLCLLAECLFTFY